MEATGPEVYKHHIHTLEEFQPPKTLDEVMSSLYDETKRRLKSYNFICLIGGETLRFELRSI